MVNVHRWTGPAGLGSCPVAPELDRERGKGVEISRLHRGQPLAVYCSSSTWQRCSPARISTRPGSVVHGRRPVRRPLFLSSTAAPDAEIVHTQFAAPAWSAGTPAERTTGPVLGRGARPRRDGRTGGSVSRAFERGRSGSQGGREGESQSGRKKVLTGDRERRHGRTGKAKRRRKRNEPAHGMDGGRLVDTRRGPRGLDSGGDKRPTARHFHMSPLYGTAGPGQLRVRPCVPQKKKKKKKSYASVSVPSGHRSYPPVCFKLPLLVGGGYSYCTLVQTALEMRSTSFKNQNLPPWACVRAFLYSARFFLYFLN